MKVSGISWHLIIANDSQPHCVTYSLEQLFHSSSKSLPKWILRFSSGRLHSGLSSPVLKAFPGFTMKQLRPKLGSHPGNLCLFHFLPPAPLASAARIWQMMCLLGQSLGYGRMTWWPWPLRIYLGASESKKKTKHSKYKEWFQVTFSGHINQV